MTAPARQKTRKANSLAVASTAAMLAAAAVACGPSYFEIPIETPIRPKMDVSPFQRVLVAGFVAGGTDDVDTNLETVRLLRSQLRTKSSLKVIDADVMPLIEIAQDQSKPAPDEAAETSAGQAPGPDGAEGPGSPGSPGSTVATTDSPGATDVMALPKTIKEQKDLEPYERLFANTAYWKTIGEEYQNPLIVTGTVLFAPMTSNAMVQRDQEIFDSFGRRSTVPTRTFMERKGFTLQPKFVFIDGRTGTTMYSEGYREQILYNAQQNTPALSSYFELMDRLVPNFLAALSDQKIRGTRVLLN
jgi:hypothetical protein